MELQDLLPAAVSVVAPAQADDPLPESEQPLVGQRDAVRVAREVFEDLARSREGFLGVDDPVVLPEISKRHVRRETGLVSKHAHCRRSRYLPRKTRDKARTGKRKSRLGGRIQRRRVGSRPPAVSMQCRWT